MLINLFCIWLGGMMCLTYVLIVDKNLEWGFIIGVLVWPVFIVLDIAIRVKEKVGERRRRK